MRLQYLSIGLLGLAGLVTTSATPIQAGQASAKRLVVYTQDHFQGPAYEINALNRCHKFDSPVYKNIRSYGVVDMDCHFRASDSCSGEDIVRADARDTEIWGRIDVDGNKGHEHMIGSVVCFDTKVVAAAGPVKRSGPGETIVCENNIDDGRCETLSANNACVAIPPDLSHRVHSIYQAAGATCNYYDTSCTAGTPTISIDSHRQALVAVLDPSVGNRIGWVMCRDYWAATEAGEASASEYIAIRPWHGEASVHKPRGNNAGPDSFSDDYNDFLDKRNDTKPATPGVSNSQPPSTPQPGSTITAMASNPAPPGDVKLCSQPNFKGTCRVFNAM